jgi:predicted MFS family arabinose efflux permease
MRRLVLAIYALILVDEIALLALVPLVPVYSDRLALSKLEAGALLSAASFAVLVTSIPIGIAADRFGARRVTLLAGVTLAVANSAQAFADTLPGLIAARVAFGVASAAVWTAALSWLSDSTSDRRRASALGAVVAVAGVGGMVGPVFAGTVAEHVSVRAVLLTLGVASAAVTLVLALMPPGGRSHHEHQPLRSVIGVARRERLIAAGVLMMVLGGFGDGVVNLLGALELTAAGLSSAATGLVFSLAAGIFIAVSALVTRIGGRAVSVRAAGIGALLQAGALVPAVASLAAGSVIAMVLLRFGFAAWTYTIGLPLGALGARRRGIGTATVNGLLGLAWGGANFLGAPLAGFLAGVLGDRAAYLVLISFCLASAAWLLRPAEREPDPCPAAAAP